MFDSRLTRTLRYSVAIVAIPLFIAFVGSSVADAGLGASATPTFPTTVTVGNMGLAASIQLENLNTIPNTASTVCNVGDALPCPVGELGITLIPSCGLLGAFSACSPTGGADPGVFQVSATGLGSAGTACAGMTFAVTLIDPAFGQLRFAPQPPGTHVQLPLPGDICRIDFTFDVLKVPSVDQDPATAGRQTVQVVDNTQHDDGSITASGRGTSNGTTVERATPTIATTPTPTIPVGSGQLADAATVSGRVNPQAGATIDFRLYGPNDATCTGAPAFESLVVPYPVAGGAVTSAAFTPTVPGLYRWIATYSGDANNFAVSGVCSDSSESVSVTPTIPVASQAPPGGPTLPATGSPSGTLVLLAFALCLTGGLLVGSTSLRRRPAIRRSRA